MAKDNKLSFLADLSAIDTSDIFVINQEELDNLNLKISDLEVENILEKFGFSPFNDFLDIEYKYVNEQPHNEKEK